MENIRSDPGHLRTVMRNFSMHSRQYPTLARDIIAIDGLSSDSSEYWQAWKDAVIDLACDASDQSHLLILIKRAVAALSGSQEGQRAVSILADLARIVPSSLELIMKHFEASFPYWKHSQSAPLLLNFTQNALNLGLEFPQLLERIIDFLTRKILLIDLSIRLEDLELLESCSEQDLSDNLKILADASSIGNLSGLGEKYSQEEKAREMEEAQKARQNLSEQVRDYLNKIDLMLLALFQFIEKVKSSTGKVREICLFILISFERHVLPASKPKFTQFLMFYAAGIDNVVADRFLGSLLAFLFSRDSQLALNHLNNQPSKAKLLRSVSKLLASFVKTSSQLTEKQLKNVNELLLDWIGRKVQALTHFSQNPTEISILAAVIECFCEISSSSFINYDDIRLKKAFEYSYTLLPSNFRTHEVFGKFFENAEIQAEQVQKHPFPSLQNLQLPLSRQFLLNSTCFII